MKQIVTENIEEGINSESDGPFIVIGKTNINYTINGKIYSDFTETKEFGRLSGIKQLGLVYAGYHNASQNQTRSFHSYLTAIMMEVTLLNNNFSPEDINLGIVAGLYHDLAMCPFSDQGKFIRSEGVEEEDLVEHLLNNSKTIQQHLQTHNVNQNKLIETIQGKGLVGSLINSKGLDIDNISYLAIDFFNRVTDTYFQNIKSKPEDMFDLYKNMKFEDEKWVFNDSNLLLDLVECRALLYQNVYNNPIHRAKEAFFKRALEGNSLELSTILKWRDSEFENWFLENNNIGAEKDFFYITDHPFKEIGREYDLTKEEELRTRVEKDNIIVEKLKSPRNALNNYVSHNNEIKLLEEIPELQTQITRVKEIIDSINYIGIYERQVQN